MWVIKGKNPSGRGEEVADDVYYRVVSPPPRAGGEWWCSSVVVQSGWMKIYGARTTEFQSVRGGGRCRRDAAVSGPCVPPPPPNVSFNERPRPVQGGDDVCGGSSDVGDGGITVLPTSPSYEDQCRWYCLRHRAARRSFIPTRNCKSTHTLPYINIYTI